MILHIEILFIILIKCLFYIAISSTNASYAAMQTEKHDTSNAWNSECSHFGISHWWISVWFWTLHVTNCQNEYVIGYLKQHLKMIIIVQVDCICYGWALTTKIGWLDGWLAGCICMCMCLPVFRKMSAISMAIKSQTNIYIKYMIWLACYHITEFNHNNNNFMRWHVCIWILYFLFPWRSLFLQLKRCQRPFVISTQP